MSRSLCIPALAALLGAPCLLAQAPATTPAPAPASTPASTPTPAPALADKPLWSFKETGAAPFFALGKEAVYVRYGGDVKRRALADGREVWSVPADLPVAEEGGLLFLINAKYELSCLDAQTGQALWKVPIEKEGEGTFGHGNVVVVRRGFRNPVVAGDLVLVGTSGGSLFRGRTGKLYAYDRKDGKLRWSFEAEDGVENQPVVAKNLVLIGGVAACYGLDLATGKQVWKASTRNDNQWFFKLAGDTLLMSSGHYRSQNSMSGGTLYAFDPATGNSRWTFDIGGPSVLGLADGRVVGLEWGSFGGSRLTCLDLASGKKLWEFKEKGTAWPVVVDGKAVHLDKDNRIHVVDLATGKAEAAIPAAGDFQMGFLSGPWGRFMDPVVLQGRAVVGSWDKAKKETVLQVLDVKQGKVVQERRLPGELRNVKDLGDQLVTVVKGTGEAYTLQVEGR
ncbi:PQQ-binding-like beta-propeller repeat protein [Geothrix alkalitolerans]|uniref:outer membrane protein assembly factor BamB family protein n=1 Tax=Geothrix alkalitolerans TaxID=2922724 RepID=UPI001FAF692A|nr:PQQ-binding-like beta-propeller repeat protein [Geothrix alkalitolerans]